MNKKTLEEILEYEKAHRVEEGDYGIIACKDNIRFILRFGVRKSLYELLERYVEMANNKPLFNTRMVLACWELINEKE